MLKKVLLLAGLVLLPGYCYSKSIVPYNGYTGNAAQDGLRWNMDNVLPSPPGLDIGNIIYNYTIEKEVDDTVSVHVQNENATGDGYVFRETDTWQPGSLGGTEINKVVPVVPAIPRDAWGDGSIEVEGPGYVRDPKVVYTYKVDPCYDPQFSPQCPGYEPPLHLIPEVDVDGLYSALDDENVDLNRKVDDDLIAKKELNEEEDLEAKEKEELDRKERLEKALAAADNTLLFATALAQQQMLDALDRSVNMDTYRAAKIPGGTYNDSVSLNDTQLPDNKQGLRNGLAQQLLHDRMVDQQYQDRGN